MIILSFPIKFVSTWQYSMAAHILSASVMIQASLFLGTGPRGNI